MLPRIVLYLCVVFFASASILDNPHVNLMKAGEAGVSTDPDFMVIIVIYDNEIASTALLETLDPIVSKYHKYFKIYLIDCATDCPAEIQGKLPSFTIKTPAGVNPYTDEPLIYDRGYEGSIEQKTILNFILDNYYFLGDVLDKENFKTFIQETGPKCLLFTNKETVPLMFKGLTSHLRSRMEFGVVFANTTSLVEKYNVETFPTLIMVDEETTKYEGKIEFNALYEFAEKYALSEKKPLKAKKKVTKEPAEEKINLPEFPVVTLNAKNFEEELIKNPKVFLVHFYTPSKELPEWEDITNLYKGIVELGEFKGDSEFVKELGIKRLPSLRLFPVNRKRKSFEIPYESKEELEEIIARELKPEITTVLDSTITLFAASVGEEHKIGCLLLTDGSVPFSFKALASEPLFRDFVKFGYYKQEEEVIKRMFKVSNFPVMLAFTQDNENESSKMLEYTGALDDFIHMYYFIDQMAIPNFLNKQTKVNEMDLDDIDPFTPRNFDSECLKKSGLCVMALFDGEPDEASPQYKTLKKIQGQMQNLPVHFGWIDAFCQYELRDALGISEVALPNLAVYTSSKMTAARLKGKMVETDISDFLDSSLRGKSDMFDFRNAKLVQRDCEELRDSIQVEDDDDEIVKEILSQSEKKTVTSTSKSKQRKKKKKQKSDL